MCITVVTFMGSAQRHLMFTFYGEEPNMLGSSEFLNFFSKHFNWFILFSCVLLNINCSLFLMLYLYIWQWTPSSWPSLTCCSVGWQCPVSAVLMASDHIECLFLLGTDDLFQKAHNQLLTQVNYDNLFPANYSSYKDYQWILLM